MERTNELLATFVRRVLRLSPNYKICIDLDLYFLADIENRSSFVKFDKWESRIHCVYTCSFLIEQKVNLDTEADVALQISSASGYKDVVALLLQYKANVHVVNDYALREASRNGHKDTVDLLLQYKANVHAVNDDALREASRNERHKDVVALLLEHKANFHGREHCALNWGKPPKPPSFYL
jgi:tRNA G18 (ribose-2'-O)-methylase SpoU